MSVLHWAVILRSALLHVITEAVMLTMAQGGFDWGDFVDGVTSGGVKKRKQDTGEPFYGFTDFLRDLDVDLKRWSDQVDKKGISNQFCTDGWCSGDFQHFQQLNWRLHLAHCHLSELYHIDQLIWVSDRQDSRACLMSFMMRVYWQWAH